LLPHGLDFCFPLAIFSSALTPLYTCHTKVTKVILFAISSSFLSLWTFLPISILLIILFFVLTAHSKPIIRPSALGNSIGSGISSPFLHASGLGGLSHTGVLAPAHREDSISSSTNSILRPPKLAPSFTSAAFPQSGSKVIRIGDRSEDCSTSNTIESSRTPGEPIKLDSNAINSSDVNSSKVETSTADSSKNVKPIFVPLAMNTMSESVVAGTSRVENSVITSGCISTKTVTMQKNKPDASDISKPSSGGFVFGSNLFDRVEVSYDYDKIRCNYGGLRLGLSKLQLRCT